ncbi:hypothetical protein LBW89_26690, partial [Paenibacillus sp. alder61]|uniref:hypothetical protein n=1 Tax=Paenibacillus sp. alder61 TaxID=2862948 RepID=UPI001CD681D5
GALFVCSISVLFKIPANLQEFPSVLASKSEKDAKVQEFSARPAESGPGSKKACRFAGISLSRGYPPKIPAHLQEFGP